MRKLLSKNILIFLSILLFIFVLYFVFRLFGFFSFKFMEPFRAMASVYTSIQSNIVSAILRLLNIQYVLDQVEYAIRLENKNTFYVQFSTLYMVSIPLVSFLWFLRGNNLQTILYFFSTIVGLFFSGTIVVIILIFIGISNPQYQYFWTNLVSNFISVSAVFFILSKQEPATLYQKLIGLTGINHRDWNIRLKILFITPIFKLFTTVIASNYLIQLVLIPSKWITTLLGANTWIEGIYLWSERTYVMLAYGCIGMHANMLFALFILMLKGGTWLEKTRFIFMGLGIIIIVNIIRISALFMYYHHNFGENVLGIDTHDMFNIAVYLTIFVLWIVWIRRTREEVSPGSNR